MIGDMASLNSFHIDPYTGDITSRVEFDYEKRSQYNVIVKAYNPNSDKYEATADVRVDIGGINEYPPSFQLVWNAYV